MRGQAQIVEKEKKHYQGLPEDLTPTAGKVGASAAEKNWRKIVKLINSTASGKICWKTNAKSFIFHLFSSSEKAVVDDGAPVNKLNFLWRGDSLSTFRRMFGPCLLKWWRRSSDACWGNAWLRGRSLADLLKHFGQNLANPRPISS